MKKDHQVSTPLVCKIKTYRWSKNASPMNKNKIIQN